MIFKVYPNVRQKQYYSKVGYIKLEDDTFIIQRVAIVDARPVKINSPFGVDFELNIIAGISPYPSEKIIEELKDKPVLEVNKQPPNTWKRVRILEMEPAIEEVKYYDEKLGRYHIKVEVEPLMVSLNTSVKTIEGKPLYIVRWTPKISWNEVE